MGALDGKVAIVTGAGRGIGRGEARLLAAEGASVIVNDLGVAREGDVEVGPSPAEEVVAEIEADGGRAIADHSDVASWAGAEALVRRAVDEFGDLHVLVNNAGILRDAMSFNMDEESWDAVIRVHLKGHFAPSRFAAAHWREQAKAGTNVYGRIINTASESGLYGQAGQANYAAAKAGIASLTIVLARELEKYGVTVNAVAPRARTRMTATVPGAEAFMAAPTEGFDEWDPDNIAPTVAFLASPLASDITAQVFVVWADHVYLMRGWDMAADVGAGGHRWSVEELASRRYELFPAGGRGDA